MLSVLGLDTCDVSTGVLVTGVCVAAVTGVVNAGLTAGSAAGVVLLRNEGLLGCADVLCVPRLCPA